MKNQARVIREGLGVTQTSVAIKAGIPCATLSVVERGANCQEKTARKIAEALGVKLEDAFPACFSKKEASR